MQEQWEISGADLGRKSNWLRIFVVLFSSFGHIPEWCSKLHTTTSKYFQINYSIIILLFEAVQSRILKAM
jgi:hypothetical protein